jgi:hypothetical protein
MPHFVNDFADDLARELAHAREILEGALDRADALAALHARALDVAAAQRRPVTIDDVFRSAKNEHERAELQLLANRITGDAGGNPASADRVIRRGHVESVSGL